MSPQLTPGRRVAPNLPVPEPWHLLFSRFATILSSKSTRLKEWSNNESEVALAIWYRGGREFQNVQSARPGDLTISQRTIGVAIAASGVYRETLTCDPSVPGGRKVQGGEAGRKVQGGRQAGRKEGTEWKEGLMIYLIPAPSGCRWRTCQLRSQYSATSVLLLKSGSANGTPQVQGTQKCNQIALPHGHWIAVWLDGQYEQLKEALTCVIHRWAREY